MPGWLTFILVIVVFFVVIPALWAGFRSLSSGTDKVGEEIESVADKVGDVLGTVVVKGVGVVVLGLGLAGLYFLVTGEFAFYWGMLFGSLFLLGYAVYLLTPGPRRVFIVF